MMNLRHAVFACLAVAALLSALPVCVQPLRAQQWQRVTAKPIFWMSYAISGGAMTYKDGILWAGAGDVKKSIDLGLTWTPTSCPKGVVYRIVFFNDSIGVVCMIGYGVFLTTDQGTTWSHVLDSTSTYDAAFGVTPDTILVTTYQDLRRTTNRGATWAYCYGTAELGPISSRNGTFYYKDHSRLFASTDAGTSWGSQPGVADYDCHSWSFDSCDASTLYVVDEALCWPDDTEAGMYVTRDLGVTWSLRNPQPKGYYCGNTATSNLAIFTQTSNGILCSSNKGVTWRNIGGPAGQPDQQLMAVVEDSILLVCDEVGNLWRLAQGIVGRAKATLLSSAPLFQQITLPICQGPFTQGIAVLHPCGLPQFVSAKIVSPTGGFTISKEIIDSTGQIDSFYIEFNPIANGYYTGKVILTYDDSSMLVDSMHVQVVTAVSKPAQIGDGHPLFFGAARGPCERPIDSSIEINYFCTGTWIRSMQITGKDSAYYTIKNVSRNPTEYVDSITISFHPDSVAYTHASLIVVYSDGTVVSIPLAGRGVPAQPIELLVPRDSLFANTKISPCDKPVTDTVILLAMCNKSLKSMSLRGTDSANYSVLRSSQDSTKQFDTIIVAFGITKPGGSAAELLVVYNDSTVTVPLAGSGIPGPPPHALDTGMRFANAHLSYCDAPLDTFVVIDEGCRGRSLASRSIGGPDSANYQFCCVTRDSARLYDTIRLTFKDSVVGASHATLSVQYDDGTVVHVPLGGFGIQVPAPRLPSNRDTLFSRVNLYPCEKPVPDHCSVILNCAKRKLKSVTLSGQPPRLADSANYTIVGVSHDTARGLDSVALTFMPDTIGPSRASLTFEYQDGSIVTVALAGQGRPVRPASITTADVYDDTIGTTVYVPITIRHDSLLSGMSFNLQYDTAFLVFDRIEWAGGAAAGTVTRLGTSELHVSLDLTGHKADSVSVVYALFDWYPADSGRAVVTIDSVETNSALPGCMILSNRQTQAIISGPVGCTTPLLIHELRYGTIPYFSIRPNPASHEIVITSNGPLDAVRISDALGRSVSVTGNTSRIDVSPFPPGLYYVQVRQGDRKAGRTLIIER